MGFDMYLDNSIKLCSTWLLLTLVLATSLDDRSGLPLFDIPLDDSIDTGSYRLIVLLTAAAKDEVHDSCWLTFKEANFTFIK